LGTLYSLLPPARALGAREAAQEAATV